MRRSTGNTCLLVNHEITQFDYEILKFNFLNSVSTFFYIEIEKYRKKTKMKKNSSTDLR